MKRISVNTLLTGALVCFATVLLFETLNLGKAARLIPEKVVVFTLCLALVQLIRDAVANKTRELTDSKFFGQRFHLNKESQPDRRKGIAQIDSHREKEALVWVLVIPVLIFFLGFIPAMFLYSSCYFRFKDGMNWAKALGISAILFGAFYLVIDFVAHTALHQGKLWDWLRI